MCLVEMFDFIAKHSPASFPALFSLIFLSMAFACSIASSFSDKKMFKSLVFGVAIFFEKFRTLFTADSFPDFISFSFSLRFILILKSF